MPNFRIWRAEHWGQTFESPLFDRKPDFKLDIDISICKVKENQFWWLVSAAKHCSSRLKCRRPRSSDWLRAHAKHPNEFDEEVEPMLMVSVGQVTRIYPENVTEKQSPTPGPCFDFDANIPGKMSGSPILVGSGILAKGVVSRSWQDDNFCDGMLSGSCHANSAPARKKPLGTHEVGKRRHIKGSRRWPDSVADSKARGKISRVIGLLASLRNLEPKSLK